MQIETVAMEIPEGSNIIIGQSHFIKTVEDLYEIMVTTVPDVKFAVAFNEASGPCLIRTEGNSEELLDSAIRNCQALQAGHIFNILMKGAYPINVLNSIKLCQEICSIYCATANPVEVIVGRTAQGSAILGVVDGFSPKGVESDNDRQDRKNLLRNIIGYKR